MLTGCFSYIFLNVDPASEWELREGALQAANKLIELMRAVLVQEHARSILVSAAAVSSRETPAKSYTAVKQMVSVLHWLCPRR
jgi:activator of HSP90 ATPase